MKGNDILALLDEPACEHNHKPKKGVAHRNPAVPQGAALLMARRSPCCRWRMSLIWCMALSGARAVPGIIVAVKALGQG